MSRKSVYLVDGVRTPFLKSNNRPGIFCAADLGVLALRELINRTVIDSQLLEEVIVGCVAPRAEEANIARIIAIRSGCAKNIPAWTVNRNCGSGMQAIDNAAQQILLGNADLVIAGGVDALSRTHMICSDKYVEFLAQLFSAKSFWQKLRVFKKFTPGMLVPISSLVKGLADPLVDLGMGHTAENLAYRYNISRYQQDEFAVNSHKKLSAAIEAGLLKDIVPVVSKDGKIVDYDNGVRADSSIDKLAKLKPYFDKKFGSVTAGNSSQITDGAVMTLLASEDAVVKYNLTPRAKIVDAKWAGLSPEVMGLGPAYAIPKLLKANDYNLSDIDYWEINEAFAAQVLACIQALNEPGFCSAELGLDDVLGEIPQNRVNIYGGAISCGHPLGASGARIVLQVLNALENNNAKLGVASQCIGGGQGGAMLIEKL